MKKLKENLKLVFVLILVSCISFGFSVYKILQSQTATNYSHSKNCEEEHYLELDCFDTCNGDQVHAHSHQQHNAPVEVVTVTSFDALTIQSLKVISTKQTVTRIPVSVCNSLFAPFLPGIFRPPAFD